jgi:preprotein translocase subunit SecY
VITLTAGTAFIMWVGEQISERGIGNGISLIIFAGIVVGIPTAIARSYSLFTTGDMTLFIVILVVIIVLAVIGVVIFFETANRKIPVQYARRQQGRRTIGGQFRIYRLKSMHPVLFHRFLLHRFWLSPLRSPVFQVVSGYKLWVTI